MKKVLAALLASYALSTGQAQGPPLPPPPPVSTGGAAPVSTLPAATATIPASTAGAPASTTGAPPVTSATAASPASTTGAPAATNPASTTAAPPAISASAAGPPPAPPAPPLTTASIPIPVPIVNVPQSTTPAPTFNPYCPPATALQKIGSAANQIQTSQQASCVTTTGPGSIARDFQGELTCNSYHCCLCSEINCGGSGFPCDRLKISDSGAVGVQNIVAIGAISTMWGIAGLTDGAQIQCTGLESCKASNIRGQYVRSLQCSGDFGCEGARALIEPNEGFKAQCNGMMTCMNSVIEIVIGPNTMVSTIETIEFNGQQAAQGATVIVRNLRADPVIIQNLECMNPTSCPNTQFIMEGNIIIENCDLQGVQNLNALPLIIQQCQLSQVGAINPNLYNPGYNPYAVPVQPVYPAVPRQPVYPAPAPLPAMPQSPALPQQPVIPQQPVAPAPAPGQAIAPSPALMLPLNAHIQLECTPAICANKIINITPTQNWKLDCKLDGACNGMVLNLNIGYDPLNTNNGMFEIVTRIDVLKFTGVSMGATININSQAAAWGAGVIEINDVRCEKIGSCTGLTINADAGIDIWSTSFDCQQGMASCSGCTVNQNGVSQGCEMANNYGQFGGFGGQQQFYQPPAVPQYQQPAMPGQGVTGQQQQQQTMTPYQQQMYWEMWQQYI